LRLNAGPSYTTERERCTGAHAVHSAHGFSQADEIATEKAKRGTLLIRNYNDLAVNPVSCLSEHTVYRDK